MLGSHAMSERVEPTNRSKRPYDIDPLRVAACRALAFAMLEPGSWRLPRALASPMTFHDVSEEPGR